MEAVQPQGQVLGAPDDIERRLLSATIALAEEGGYEAVRQRDVAARAGVALATVYARFSGKDDLLAAALDYDSEAWVPVLARLPLRGRTPLARVSKLFEHITELMLRRPNLARASLRAATSGHHGATLRLMRAQERLMRVVVRALRGPRSRPDLTEEQARRVAMVLVMVWFANLTGWAGGVSDPVLVTAIMNNSAELVLHGVVSGDTGNR